MTTKFEDKHPLMTGAKQALITVMLAATCKPLLKDWPDFNRLFLAPDGETKQS
jgi:hypothetical protein